MLVTLTIVRYKKIFIPFAFLSMAVFRLPLWLNKKIKFYKLMGSGKNGSFDKVPDLQQWAILSVTDSQELYPKEESTVPSILGKFIRVWFTILNCEVYTMYLQPIEGHGTWDTKQVFGALPRKSDYEGRIAVLTRATIRLSKLRYFWQNVASVADRMNQTEGFKTSFGIGEIPWIKQATFSVWENKNAMLNFAYGMKEHQAVIQKTHQQNWYSEDMFTRFIILSHIGTVKGIDPLI